MLMKMDRDGSPADQGIVCIWSNRPFQDLVPHPEAMPSELRIPLPSREGYRVLQVTYLFSGRLRSAHRASLCMQKESPRSAAKPYCHQLHQPSSALVSPDLTRPSNAQPITHYYVGQTVIVNIASSSSGSIPLIPTVAIAHFAFHPLTHPITTEAPSLFAAQPRGTERTDPPGEGTLVGALATALFCNRETRSGGFPCVFFLLPRASVCPRETIIPGVCICVRRDVRPLLCAMYILPYDSMCVFICQGFGPVTIITRCRSTIQRATLSMQPIHHPSRKEKSKGGKPESLLPIAHTPACPVLPCPAGDAGNWIHGSVGHYVVFQTRHL